MRQSFATLSQNGDHCYRNYVKFKFPKAPQSLIDQLGRSICIRGRSMYYLQQHDRKSLMKGGQISTLTKTKETTTEPSKDDELNIQVNLLATLKSKDAIVPDVKYPDTNEQQLTYPRMPNVGKGQQSFHCPIFFELLETTNLTKCIW
ncbi:hypothetical protein V8C35DRAFT_319093 [Trichoderma chlorosporum]